MKADLHVHSIYSNHPSDWFLQRIGAGESYSKPEAIYAQAKSRGMDLVTITDHNKIDGSLELVRNHPDDCFTGVESTAYFPEDGCKVHILIYGFSKKQFEKIEKKRKNIYQLRDWLVDKKLPHAVAHPVHSVNKRLTPEHFEKLILLFNVFEGLNGQKGQFGNEETVSVLENLDPPTINSLIKKHQIQPVGKQPWSKSLIGGSDDRAGLFIGKTYTEIKASNISEFVDKISKGKAKAFGRHNNFQALAFTVYKVAWEYSEHKSGKFANNLLKNINGVIFGSGNLSLSSKLKLTGYKLTIKEDDIISKKIIELIEDLERTRDKDPEKRIDQVFKQISELSDAIIENLVSYLIENVQDLNLINAFTRLMTMLPTVFLAAPFITALNYLYTDRKLIMSLGNHLESYRDKRKNRILWFSDTIDDLNGVSETLKELDKWIEKKDLDIKIATCISDQDDRSRIPKNLIEFEKIMDFRPEYYKTYVLKVPSFLESLKVIQEFNPDVIYLSTPGFIGLLGMAAARLMHIPTYGIFHTDFVGQMGDIAQDEALNENIRTYINWFYSSCDFIASPTRSYVPILEGYGFPKEKIKLFRRWIDCSIFRPMENAKEKVYKKYDLPDGPLMLFTGRISRDKNLDLSIDVFNQLKKEFPGLSYLIFGFGPYADELKEKTSKIDGIQFPGKVERNELPEIYSAADLFIFPSVNDTFGLSVLESQACGLPCFVTKVGGPAEIIEHEKSGFILDPGPAELWTERIRDFLKNPDNRKMRENAVNRAKNNYDIHEVLNKLIIDI